MNGDIGDLTHGIKFDSEKTRLDLLDVDWLEDIGKVLTYGAKKYTTRKPCTCHVSILQKVASLGPKVFVSLATIPRTNGETSIPSPSSPSTNERTELGTRKSSTSTDASTLSKILNLNNAVVEQALNASTGSMIPALIESLLSQPAKSAEETANSASTTTILPDLFEAGCVRRATLLLGSLSEAIGQLPHSRTCENGVVVESGANNWRKGIKLSRLIAALMRHLFAFARGEDSDPETGLPHLAHAGCCLMFLAALHKQRPDLDDRPKWSDYGPPQEDCKVYTPQFRKPSRRSKC